LLAHAPQAVLKSIEGILISYITDMIGRPPKMAKYVLTP
jgi:hypothetical protein